MLHSLDQTLNHCICGRLNRYATRMLGGARRPRPVNHFREACRLLALALRIADRMARRDPHLFGPHARRYFLDTLQLEKQQQEAEAALRKVYGPPPPGQPERVSTLWTDRYFPQTPLDRRIHRNWFKQQYGRK